MNCHSCEFPLEWDGVSPIVVCELCRTYRSTDTPDGTGERIVSLNRTGQWRCPCCRRNLSVAAMDGLKVEHCADCEGVLMDSDVFAMFVRNRREEFREAASQPTILVTDRLAEQRHCPECRRAMAIHPCYGPSLMIVESCVRCGMVWLDCREWSAVAVG